jgi:hypothetical protein
VLSQKRIFASISLFVALSSWSQAAAQAPVSIAGYQFQVADVVFDETALGFIPADMDPASHVVLVELELLSGSKDAFKNLEVQISCGKRSAPTGAIIQIAEGMVKMLSTVTMTGSSSDYRPDTKHVTWAFVVPRETSGLLLKFPTGETLELSPYIR